MPKHGIRTIDTSVHAWMNPLSFIRRRLAATVAALSLLYTRFNSIYV
ncbi:hypothetical protein [Paenibacillus crassostreae]|nr:hypothetical protein [Paenibacillus crassostreae]